MTDKDGGPIPPLPNAAPIVVSPTITIQPPLSRRGTGPGLILIVPAGLDLSANEKTLDPPPLQKWAEESFAVAQVVVSEFTTKLEKQIHDTVDKLQELPQCDRDPGIAVIIYKDCLERSFVSSMDNLRDEFKAIVFYGSAPGPLDFIHDVPALAHVSETPAAPASLNINRRIHGYPKTGPFFAIPAHPDYRAGAAAVAHTRTLSFLKKHLDAPLFDLEAIWDEHTRFEFADRSVERTMSTMVAQPYVNHVPTLTGGIGREALTSFYRDHFIFSNSDDAHLELVSRTVGVDRVVDEFLFECTHDRRVDWLLPGVPLTGKKLSIPFTAIVNIRGDRLYHEHISWDQGTALRQLGLMPEYLPFPYPVEGGEGKKWEYRVPIAGVETAKKLADEKAVESNGMLEFGVREVKEEGA